MINNESSACIMNGYWDADDQKRSSGTHTGHHHHTTFIHYHPPLAQHTAPNMAKQTRMKIILGSYFEKYILLTLILTQYCVTDKLG